MVCWKARTLILDNEIYDITHSLHENEFPNWEWNARNKFRNYRITVVREILCSFSDRHKKFSRWYDINCFANTSINSIDGFSLIWCMSVETFSMKLWLTQRCVCTASNNKRKKQLSSGNPLPNHVAVPSSWLHQYGNTRLLPKEPKKPAKYYLKGAKIFTALKWSSKKLRG